MLYERGRSYGYDLSRDLEQHSFTDAAIERAALYRTLNIFERNGFVTSEWETKGLSGPARKVYSLTEEGEQHLQEWAQVLKKVSKSMSRFVRRTELLNRSRGRPVSTESRRKSASDTQK
jgi:DNA-binding PadR family transcriptional regulator